MLVNLREILKDTRKNHYAVGLFNCVSQDMARGVLAAAEGLSSPVVLGSAERLLPGASLDDLYDMLHGMAARARVPVALHFDHGFHPELVRRAVDLGFTSVMYDCSRLPFEENIARIREMTEYAHRSGCSLEAELGHVGENAPGDPGIYTRAEDAARFTGETGCDALAVAIGTAHGVYKEKPKLSFGALEQIAAACPTPLVLHGGSGLSDDDFRRTVACGISKINIFTDNNLAAARAAHEAFTGSTGLFELAPVMEEAVRAKTAYLIRVFGSDGKA